MLFRTIGDALEEGADRDALAEEYRVFLTSFFKPKSEITAKTDYLKKKRNIAAGSSAALGILQFPQNFAENNRRGWRQSDGIPIFASSKPHPVGEAHKLCLLKWAPNESFFPKMFAAL